MEIKTNKSLNQTLIPSLAMQQAFFVLQLPQLELAEWLCLQIEQNPLLEYKESRGEASPVLEEKELDFSKQDFEVLDYLDDTFKNAVFPDDQEKENLQEETLSYPMSLFDHLRVQAKEVFSSQQLEKAETIIGSLDHRGFLGETPVDEEILKIIQTFDPPGIAARDLKESLLIQLDSKGKKDSLLYTIISAHFQDLLQNRFPDIEKRVKIPAHSLKKKIKKELFALDFQPGARFITPQVPSIVPDIFIYKVGGNWEIDINDSYLPPINILDPEIENLSSSDKSYVRTHLTKGNWLLHIIDRRHAILKRIALYLLKYQEDFFNGDLAQLIPLNMQEAAKELGVNASTIARATSHKYLSAPHGIFSLRNFFSHALKTYDGKTISHHTVKHLLLDLIAKENKKAPLSDDRIMAILCAKGINCARRTITKYRKSLHIPSSQQRRD